MDLVIRIILPFICVVLAEAHFIDPSKSFFDLHLGPHHHEHKESKGPSNDRPINGDIFSYNTQHDDNHFYHDEDPYDPAMNSYPYYGYLGPFDNIDPYGVPSINNEFNIPPHYDSNYGNGNHHHQHFNQKPNSKGDHSGEDNSVEDKNNHDKPKHKEPPAQNDKAKPVVDSNKVKNVPPITNQVPNDKATKEASKKDNVNINANKDYLLVGNNGNGVYLLHQSTPNVNPVVLPNTNQPVGSNVVYVHYNPPVQPAVNPFYQVVNGQSAANPVYSVVSGQPASNPVYSVVSGQPAANPVYQVANRQPAANPFYQVASRQPGTPLAPNRLNLNGYNNVAPVPRNPLPNNNNPAYILIYANGELIQVPGIIINSPPSLPVQNGNQGSSVVLPNTNVPAPNYVHANTENQVPPVSSNVPNVPNNNVYGVNSQPNSVPQPNGIVNAYLPSNTNRPIPAGSVNNNEGIQPAMALALNNNNNQYQSSPAKEKEPNSKTPANATPANTNQAENSQPAAATSEPNENILETLGAQPAVMVSGFKESDNPSKSEPKDGKDNKKKDDTKAQDTKKNSKDTKKK